MIRRLLALLLAVGIGVLFLMLMSPPTHASLLPVVDCHGNDHGNGDCTPAPGDTGPATPPPTPPPTPISIVLPNQTPVGTLPPTATPAPTPPPTPTPTVLPLPVGDASQLPELATTFGPLPDTTAMAITPTPHGNGDPIAQLIAIIFLVMGGVCAFSAWLFFKLR